MSINIEDDFNTRLEYVDEKNILKLNTVLQHGSLNNLVVGINDQCFSYWLENNLTEEYCLFYACYNEHLEGYLLKINLSHTNRDELILLFSKFISQEYKNTDLIDTYNYFQSCTRDLAELIGYSTTSNIELNQKGPGSLVIKGNKFTKITYIEKDIFYRSFFNFTNQDIIRNSESAQASFIYLMLNKRNNYTKIGSSKTPAFREKTLQADEPEIILIACWLAPISVEKILHKTFAGKKQRGEWFKLTFNDFQKIKDMTFQYEIHKKML